MLKATQLSCNQLCVYTSLFQWKENKISLKQIEDIKNAWTTENWDQTSEAIQAMKWSYIIETIKFHPVLHSYILFHYFTYVLNESCSRTAYWFCLLFLISLDGETNVRFWFMVNSDEEDDYEDLIAAKPGTSVIW